MQRWKKKKRVLQPGLQPSTHASPWQPPETCCVLDEHQVLLADAQDLCQRRRVSRSLETSSAHAFNKNGLKQHACREFSFSRGIVTVLKNIRHVPKWEIYYIGFLKREKHADKGRD